MRARKSDLSSNKAGDNLHANGELSTSFAVAAGLFALAVGSAVRSSTGFAAC
jgi:hypothetical protein